MSAPGGRGDDVVGDDVVRGFMLTRGRTRATVPELPLETVLSTTSFGTSTASTLDVDQRRIVELLAGPLSIAEVSAHLGIPLRAAIVLTSEMTAAGTLRAGGSIGDADTDLLQKIRSALQLL